MSKNQKVGLTPFFPCSRVAWQASWLKDPVFDGITPRHLVDPHRKPENNGEIQNVHTLFRREFVCDKTAIRRARLYITADDCYKLYLNGRFIGTGPAPAEPSDYRYNAWDVTDLLTEGALQCIGVHTFYLGMHCLTFPSGDNLQGLLLQLEIDRADGSTQILVSDGQWRCCNLDAYESRQVFGYQTAFSEHIDLRRLPYHWARIGYDDSEWQLPLMSEIPAEYVLTPQVTPPVVVYKRSPARVVKKGAGHYFVDFGSELCGQTAFRVSGEPGHEVEIRHGEETDAPDSVRYDMRCNCVYQEFCKLSGRMDEELTFFDYKGFRYVEVLNWPEELTQETVWAYERHYPFPPDASGFTSSNPRLNDIWDLCRNGVRVGTQDTYLDCPTREKGGFLGDGFVTGMSHLVCTGDSRIMRKFLKDVANTQRYCPGLSSTAPNYINGELAEYSLLWPVLLDYYYQWTGDLEFVHEMMPVLETMLQYFAGYENEDSLLQDLYSHATGRYSILVDWPKNLRDDYDDPYLMGDRREATNPDKVVNTMVQGFYLYALQAAGKLAEITEASSLKQHVRNRQDCVASALCRLLRNPETGLFIDRNGSDHSALHANLTPLLAGVLSSSEQSAVLDFIRQKRLSCGVYFSFFVLQALYDVGESELAYDLMVSDDRHSWRSMLAAGASTCMEAWAPDLKWNTSWCHPWSSAPITMITHHLMGVAPGSPGWETIRFVPRPPAALASAAIQISTPQGIVKASYEQDDKKVVYKLSVPENCVVTCCFDTSVKAVTVNGAACSCRRQTDVHGQPSTVLNHTLAGGDHCIVAAKTASGVQSS